MRSMFAMIMLTGVMFALGSLAGAQTLLAEKEQDACGSGEASVCTYDSNGCDPGELCKQYQCAYGGGSCWKLNEETTRCWLCRPGN